MAAKIVIKKESLRSQTQYQVKIQDVLLLQIDYKYRQ